MQLRFKVPRLRQFALHVICNPSYYANEFCVCVVLLSQTKVQKHFFVNHRRVASNTLEALSISVFGSGANSGKATVGNTFLKNRRIVLSLRLHWLVRTELYFRPQSTAE